MAIKERVAGAALLVGLVSPGLALLTPLIGPDSAAGPLARILETFAPWMIAAGAVCAIAATGLGARRSGSALILCAVLAAGLTYSNHRALSLPLADARPDLRILLFNVLEDNTAPADDIVEAVLAQDADVVVLLEAGAIMAQAGILRDTYEFVSECSGCDFLVASRARPDRFWTLRLNPIRDDRYGVLELPAPSGGTFFLAVSHLVKPWLTDIAGFEQDRLSAQMNWLEGPTVVVGDFNRAPWARPMLRLLRDTGFRMPRRPVATWPARAGVFGVPIDHILVRDGPRIVALKPFGGTLGSNHRGLVADLSVGPGR